MSQMYPVIRVKLESMAAEIAHFIGPHLSELEPGIRKACAEALTEVDIERTVKAETKRIIESVVTDAVRSALQWHPGIRAAIAKRTEQIIQDTLNSTN